MHCTYCWLVYIYSHKVGLTDIQLVDQVHVVAEPYGVQEPLCVCIYIYIYTHTHTYVGYSI